MLPGGQLITQDHISPSVSSLDGLAATSFGIFVQTICPVLLAVGLFTRLAALALLVQLLVFTAVIPRRRVVRCGRVVQRHRLTARIQSVEAR